MAMDIQGFAGPQTLSDGAKGQPRLLREGSMGVSEIHGRYYEHTRRGNVFMASLQAAQVLTGLNAVSTGLVLSNPFGSGVLISLLDVCIALATAPAGISVIALAGVVRPSSTDTVHTTPLIVRPAVMGAANSAVGLADSSATLSAAPVIIRPIGGGPVAAGSVSAPFIRDEIAGSVALLPGTAVCLAFLTTAISLLASMAWEENPL